MFSVLFYMDHENQTHVFIVCEAFSHLHYLLSLLTFFFFKLPTELISAVHILRSWGHTLEQSRATATLKAQKLATVDTSSAMRVEACESLPPPS